MAIEGKMKTPKIELKPAGNGAVLLKFYDANDPLTFMEINLSEKTVTSLVTNLMLTSAMK